MAVGQIAQKKPDPCSFVIFGVTGDLAHRLVVPALYNLAAGDLLPDRFCLVGVARKGTTSDRLRDSLMKGLRQFATQQVDEAIAQRLLACVTCIEADPKEPESFDAMSKQLDELEATRDTGGNRLFYLATPPNAFLPISRELGRTGMLAENGTWRRLVVEKPFGTDLASAKALNSELLKLVEEQQIYRIDHYLGKETVQNILVLRFANGMFEPIWNRRYIDHVQLTVAETVGVEERGPYYDATGALRDMVPNHIFQLITLMAMEPPISFEADAVRDEQTRILRAMQPLTPEEVLLRTVRGQYSEGVIDGDHVPGYRSEPRVPQDSRTETFVALKLLIDNWRWADVPFYLRTGKRLAARSTQVMIQFRRAPFVLFRDTPVENLMPNQLVLHIQPEEGISLRFAAKVPGPVMRLGPVDMNFAYADYFGQQPNTGYERLLHDCMIGDPTLFQRADMVEAGWCVVSSVLDVWKALPPRNFPNYAAGTWGPKEAEELLERDGRHWRNFEK